MMGFAVDYYLMVVISACGALQFAASREGLRGLRLFRSVAASRALAAALVVGGFALFFGWEERNVNDYEGGLDGNAQGVLFLLGAITAFAVTAGASSIANRRMTGAPRIEDGIENLARTTYGRALAGNLRFLRERWRTWTRPYFFG